MRRSPLTAREPTPNRPGGNAEYRATRRRWGPPAQVSEQGGTPRCVCVPPLRRALRPARQRLCWERGAHGQRAEQGSGVEPPRGSADRERPDRRPHRLLSVPEPEQPGTVTMIANVIPIEAPPEGPNYYNLDDSARYRFNIDWNGDGKADRTWTLRTHTTTAYPGTFLYNIGPVRSIDDANLSVRQTWTLWSQKGNGPSVKVGLASPRPTTSARTPSPTATTRCASRPITTLGDGTQGLRRAERGSVRDRRRPDLRPDRRRRQGHRQPGRPQRAFDRHPGAALPDPPVRQAAGHRRLGSSGPHGRRQERRQLARCAAKRPGSSRPRSIPGAHLGSTGCRSSGSVSR